MNNKTDIDVQYVSPLKKICMTIGELPSSYLETMSYYEMLVWFTEFLKNQVIPTVNNNAEAVQELQSLYEELRTYVNDYFDNLDVQDEIDNKLEAMAESGQLTDIIAQYLGLAGMIAFDNVADMKLAENLVNGSKCRTLGYHTVNDGGGAYYKIRTVTNDDVVDDATIIAVYDDNLIAELIIDENTSILHFGAYENDNTKESENDTAIALMLSKLGKLFIPKGIFYISDEIAVNNCYIIIEGNLYYSGNDYCINFSNLSNKNVKINTIITTTGGGVKLAPTSGNNIQYNDFEIIQISSKNNALLLDGTNGAIALNKFSGQILRSTNEDTISMLISSGTSTWINENIFNGFDIKSTSKYGVLSNATGTSVEIQYKLENCDLENSKGIHSLNDTKYITLSNCRLNEVVSKNDWIWIEEKLPLITILGEGYLYPSKIKLTNISTLNNRFLQTNMFVQSHSDGRYYAGAFMTPSELNRLDVTHLSSKTITAQDLTDDHYYELPSGYNVNQFDTFYCNLSVWLQITIPTPSSHYREFLFYNGQSGYSREFKTSSNSTTIASMDQGWYKFYVISGKPYYVKLSS